MKKKCHHTIRDPSTKTPFDTPGDTDIIHINQITTQDLRAFPAWLRTDYKPRRLCGGDDPLSPKTVRNFWVTLSAFFRWACDEFDIPNPMKGVPAPRFEEAPVEPLSEEQVEALLRAAEYCREADTTDRRKLTMRRATARRDRALIVILLDTGLRASELCSLRIGDIDQKTGREELTGSHFVQIQASKTRAARES